MGDSGDMVHLQDFGKYNRLLTLYLQELLFSKYFLPFKEIPV